MPLVAFGCHAMQCTHNLLACVRATAPLQVPASTPHTMPAEASTPRTGPGTAHEHCSPSPSSGIPSPERHLWQVAAQAVDRGVELTARARQKRLFRSRSEAPSSLAATAAALATAEGAEGRERSQDDSNLDMLRVHSRVALLGGDLV